MAKKVTPQEVHEVYVQVFQHAPCAASEGYQDAARPWEELSDVQRALFAEMARKLNMIVGEFIVDDEK